MIDLQVFKNTEFGSVRTATINDTPFLVGRDVASILGYRNTRDALARHVDEEDKKTAICNTCGGKQKLVVINESGLYSLILSSKLPKAKQFKHWVTSEVIPSIHKYGLYALDMMLDNPDAVIDALQDYKKDRLKRKELEKQSLQCYEGRYDGRAGCKWLEDGAKQDDVSNQQDTGVKQATGRLENGAGAKQATDSPQKGEVSFQEQGAGDKQIDIDILELVITDTELKEQNV